jgi:hypothetical protein
MSGVTGDLVPEPLGGNDGNLITDPLVGLEVERQLGVVALNDDLGGLLDGLSSDATHFGDLLCELGEEVVVGRGGGCRVSWVVAGGVGMSGDGLDNSRNVCGGLCTWASRDGYGANTMHHAYVDRDLGYHEHHCAVDKRGVIISCIMLVSLAR